MNLTPAAVLERAAYEDALGNRRTAEMLRALVKDRSDIRNATLDDAARRAFVTAAQWETSRPAAHGIGDSILALKDKENRT